ncbi:hypothetical protein JCM15519_33700 [Fundidesulfovibrio butyratiphilus]
MNKLRREWRYVLIVAALACSLLGGSLCGLSPTFAATQGQDELNRAKALFLQGQEADGKKEYKRAKGLFQQALAIQEARLDKNNLDLANTLFELGWQYINLDEYVDAVPYLERALGIRERSLGKESLEAAEAVNGLGYAYVLNGEPDKGKPCLERALVARERHLGGDHQLVGNTLKNLGECFIEAGDYNHALEYFEKVKRIRSLPEASSEDYALSIQFVALAYWKLGDLPKARYWYEYALALYEAMDAKSKPVMSGVLTDLGGILRELGEYPKAKQCLDRALSILQKAGSDSVDTAKTLDQVGLLYSCMGEYEKAKSIHERTLSIRKEYLGPNSPWTAYSMRLLGDVLLDIGDITVARPMLEECLSLYKKRYGEKDLHVAVVMEVISKGYKQVGEYSKALENLKLARDILSKRSGQDGRDLANVLNDIGVTYGLLGDEAQSLVYFERALKIQESSLGPEHPWVAIRLNNIGTCYEHLGDYEKAKAYLERAVVIQKKRLGDDHVSTATTEHNLGAIYLVWGDYAAAKTLFEKAAAVRERKLGKHVDTAQALSNLAMVYYRLGSYDKARQLGEKALDIYETVRGSSNPVLVHELSNLSFFYSGLGDHKKARALCERALSLSEKYYGTEHLRTGESAAALGSALDELGDHEASRNYRERALAIREQSFGLFHPDTAAAMHNLSRSYERLGATEKERELRRKAVMVVLLSGHEEWKKNILDAYSRLLVQLGRPGPAIYYGKQAVNIVQTMRQRGGSLEIYLQKNLLQKNSFVFTRLADLLMAQGRIPEAQQVLRMLKEEEYFDFVRRDASQGDVRATKAVYTPEEAVWARRFEEFSSRMKPLATEYTRLKGLKMPDETQKRRLEELEKQLAGYRTEFTSYLADLEKSLGAAQVKPLDLPDTKVIKADLRQLGDGAVLLHYIVAENKLWVILTTSDGIVHKGTDIASSEVNTLVAQYRERLKSPSTDPMPMARRLYDLLLGPIASDLEKAHAKNLMVSLDGSLRYVPFAALHDGQGYLVQKYGVAMFTEAARGTYLDTPVTHWRMIGLGLTHAKQGFAPLPGVRAEMEAISHVLPGNVYLDNDFTLSVMRTALGSGQPVMHIASHFHFKPGTERDSFLLVGDGSRLTLEAVKTDLNFKGLDMLTLSACETAVGGGTKMGDGREVESFGALAQRKGAKGVLATLWPVADESTALFMECFYNSRENKKLSRSQALRQTQMAFLEGRITQENTSAKRGEAVQASRPETTDARTGQGASAGYAHPFYWAPFILMGNWR